MMFKIGFEPVAGHQAKPLAGKSWAGKSWIAKPWTLEGLVFCGAYVAAIAVAALVLVSSRAELRSAGAWLVFIVFVSCLTAIFALFRKARIAGGWQGRGGRDHN
ncbi:hypothetical protein SAMN05519103_04337 [Rhizobiales bacterium GAS113]|nr:hypothetical protein SAMN05519103_04337 [Rhizobiales bacterium GAS113]